MRAIILLVFLFAADILAAQDELYAHRGPDRPGTPDNSTPEYTRKFLKTMKLTDSATAYLYKTNGDTSRVMIRYSPVAMIEKMQSFVYAESKKDSIKIYNPMELKGYCVLTGADTITYMSMDNTLEIASVFTPAFAFKKQKMIGATKKIFLNCMAGGYYKLFRYITAEQVAKGSFSTTFDPNAGDANASDPLRSEDKFASTDIRYCYQKGSGELTELTKETLAELFNDCSEARSAISKKTMKDEAELKKVFSIYNHWKEQASAPPARY
jgi:hypothetical protein